MAEQSIMSRHGTSEAFLLAQPDHPRTTQGSLRSQLLSHPKILYKVLPELPTFQLFSKALPLGLLHVATTLPFSWGRMQYPLYESRTLIYDSSPVRLSSFTPVTSVPNPITLPYDD